MSGIVIGNLGELFFNKESKSGTWEVTYDSSNDVVRLFQFDDKDDDACNEIKMTKKEFSDLQKFVASIKLKRNFKLNKKK